MKAATGACAAINRSMRWLFSRQNLYALILCLVVLLVIIMTTDSAPLWIYQGF